MKKRTSKQRGGNVGQIYSFGGPITPGAPIGNTAEVIPQSSCLAVERFGTIPTPTENLGLPGMSGGRRVQTRKGRKRSARRRAGNKRRGKSNKQRGGRYSFNLETQLAPATPWAGGIPQVMQIPCEAAIRNPLNPVQLGGVGGVDSAFLASPTAGYTNVASSWVGSTGAPSLLQTPYDARTTPPVCIKTGGARKHSRKHRKGSRRH